jgi:anti-anti-sigma factor
MKPAQHTGDAATTAASRGGDALPELLEIVALTDRIGVQVVGQIDLTVRAQWESALAALTDESTEDLHVDLTGLTFIDVRGTAALVEMARALDQGQRVVLQHPPGVLIRILETMWPGQLPTITIEAS